LLAKINRSTEKYHSLLKRALAIIIGLLYLQLTDHANVPWAAGIIIFMQGFPETWKLFQGFLQGKKIEKGYTRPSRTALFKVLYRDILTCGNADVIIERHAFVWNRKRNSYLVSTWNNWYIRLIYQILTAASMKMTVFCDIAPCSVIEVDQRIRTTYCLRHHPDYRGKKPLRDFDQLERDLCGLMYQNTIVFSWYIFSVVLKHFGCCMLWAIHNLRTPVWV
jgi:hypothetical protein